MYWMDRIRENKMMKLAASSLVSGLNVEIPVIDIVNKVSIQCVLPWHLSVVERSVHPSIDGDYSYTNSAFQKHTEFITSWLYCCTRRIKLCNIDNFILNKFVVRSALLNYYDICFINITKRLSGLCLDMYLLFILKFT